MSNEKICPIMSKVTLHPGGAPQFLPVYCCEEQCKFWHYNDCSFITQVGKLDSIALAIESN